MSAFNCLISFNTFLSSGQVLFRFFLLLCSALYQFLIDFSLYINYAISKLSAKKC